MLARQTSIPVLGSAPSGTANVASRGPGRAHSAQLNRSEATTVPSDGSTASSIQSYVCSYSTGSWGRSLLARTGGIQCRSATLMRSQTSSPCSQIDSITGSGRSRSSVLNCADSLNHADLTATRSRNLPVSGSQRSTTYRPGATAQMVPSAAGDTSRVARSRMSLRYCGISAPNERTTEPARSVTWIGYPMSAAD
jgi:hypothetical protein